VPFKITQPEIVKNLWMLARFRTACSRKMKELFHIDINRTNRSAMTAEIAGICLARERTWREGL